MLDNKLMADSKAVADTEPTVDSKSMAGNKTVAEINETADTKPAAAAKQACPSKSVRITLTRPMNEDCSTEVPSTEKPYTKEQETSCSRIPHVEEHDALSDEKHEVLIPILNSMTKVLFDRYRLHMYTYLNRLLYNGTLSCLVGRKVLNDRIRANVCNFKNVSYWRINRENFYAVVDVNLKLTTATGPIDWNGHLLCWCSFENKLVVTMEDLTADLDMASEGLELLDRYLVPYSTNQHVDRVAEEMWKKYIPEALDDPDYRDAAELASRMGLSIQYRPVYDHKHMANSILFLIEDTLEVGEDRYVKIVDDRESDEDRYAEDRYTGPGENGYIDIDESGTKHIKAPKSQSVIIPANTIVVNTNCIKRDYSAYNIFHECYHYENHYLFFRLQELASNDTRRIPVKKIVVKKGEVVKNAVYFMENQANRGAYGLMMPSTHTKKMIVEECRRAQGYQNEGEKYEIAGKAMNSILGIPDSHIKTRMIQLGHVEARGCLNRAGRERIEPYGFRRESWKDDSVTFNVELRTVKLLRKKNVDLDQLFTSGKYVYANGHVAKNDPRYVVLRDGKLYLTVEARRQVDDCCLRFTRLYVQRDVSNYVYGRMYYDADYIKQTEFYLSDIINREQVDELDAKEIYIDRFPVNFRDAIKMLKKKAKLTDAALAEYLNMDDSTFMRWIDDPKKYRNEDFLTLLCLFFKLPDWISQMVFKRAKFQLDEDDRRHRALLHILRVQSNDGVQAANDYLTCHGLEPLKI